jgi:predicted nucleotidyltransferase
MRITNKLDDILNQPAKVKTLRFLFNEREEHTGRAVAKAIGMSPSYTYMSLQELKQIGVIVTRRKGNSILYKLKDDNYFVRNLLIPLFEKEKSVYSDIITMLKEHILKNKKAIISIAIFGSVAQSQESQRSDIDVLIVVAGTSDKNKVIELTEELERRLAKSFNVALSPYIVSKNEIIQKHKKNKQIIKSILNNNRLIYGEPLERILA